MNYSLSHHQYLKIILLNIYFWVNIVFVNIRNYYYFFNFYNSFILKFIKNRRLGSLLIINERFVTCFHWHDWWLLEFCNGLRKQLIHFCSFPFLYYLSNLYNKIQLDENGRGWTKFYEVVWSLTTFDEVGL